MFPAHAGMNRFFFCLIFSTIGERSCFNLSRLFGYDLLICPVLIVVELELQLLAGMKSNLEARLSESVKGQFQDEEANNAKAFLVPKQQKG